jgi:hypothetical protein
VMLHCLWIWVFLLPPLASSWRSRYSFGSGPSLSCVPRSQSLLRVRISSRWSGFDFCLSLLLRDQVFVKSRLFNCALSARLQIVRCRSPVFRSSRSIWFSPPPGSSARGIGYRWLGHLCEFSAGLPRLPIPLCARSNAPAVRFS